MSTKRTIQVEVADPTDPANAALDFSKRFLKLALYHEDGSPHVPGGGTPGPAGASTYDIWVANGNVGTVNDYLASLVGPRGIQGPQGPQGAVGAQGPAGPMGPQELVDLFHFAQLFPADISGTLAASAVHTTIVSRAGKYEVSIDYSLANSSIYNYVTLLGIFGGTAARLDNMGDASDWGEPTNDGSASGKWTRYFSTPDASDKTITTQIKNRVDTGGSGNVNQFPMNASVAVKYLGP